MFQDLRYGLRLLLKTPVFTFIAVLTLEDVVEFFNLIQELKLTRQEKADMVAFLRAL